MRFAHRGDLVQRPAGEPAAEHGVDRLDPERRHAGVFQAGRALKQSQGFSQLFQHCKPLK
jgi:hypothetical protein